MQNILANFAWIFLILGVFWGTTAANQFRIGYQKNVSEGFPLSPWITGALVSIYLFGGNTVDVRREAFIYWPVISAMIAALPDFVGDEMKLKIPPGQKRQNLVVLFGTQMLLSCWFQFYFVLQDWLVEYPSLAADNFQQSAFVIKWESPLSAATPRGAVILDAIAPKLKDQLDGKLWSQVERRLLPEERNQFLDKLAQETQQQTSSVEEDHLWQMKSQVTSRRAGYNLELQAIWQGPRSSTQNYSVTKSCQITQVYRQRNAATKPLNGQQTSQPETVSRFVCQGVKGWGVDQKKQPSDRLIQL